MSYKKATIKKLIEDIDQHKIYLPALQRRFVWGKHQIELLFDSLMRNYPFGTFLLWQLHRQKADQYVFYEFLTEYDERNPYNRRKTGAFLHEEITGVLDGQQRLSSIYIGLMGTHTERIKYSWASNPNNYEKTCLYLNLLSLPYTLDAEDRIVAVEEQNFEFRFLSDKRAAASITRKVPSGEDGKTHEEPMFWLKVGQSLQWDDDPEFDRILEKLQDHCQTNAQREALIRRKRFIKRGLETLHRRIHIDELINYFEIAKDDLEDILKIFVRVNSGGTVLSKSDLLFSTIVATWDDGREQIEELIKRINKKGDGFSFGHEYLMRCCLVLGDGPAVYKVNSFRSENVETIRANWPQIAAAVEKTIDLLVEFGFSGPLLTSQNATLLIAYYIYKGGDLSRRSKDELRKYLIHALLNRVFTTAADQIIATLRNAMREETKIADGVTKFRLRQKHFSFEALASLSLPGQKSLRVTADDIERFLQYKKGVDAFLVLSLLYPQLRYQEVIFHQDHIHPAASFTDKNLAEIGIAFTTRLEWLERRDCVPNLQLMEGRLNESKNAKPFVEWLKDQSKPKQEAFLRANYIPDGVSLDFKDFIQFYDARKAYLRSELEKVLSITRASISSIDIEWSDIEDELETSDMQNATGTNS